MGCDGITAIRLIRNILIVRVTADSFPHVFQASESDARCD
jgi:hypothetical protein